MDAAITRMSSKGQIVIPQELRKGIKEGEKMIIIKNEDQLIIKKVSSLKENFMDDLHFARLSEKAYKDYLEGKFKSMESGKFLDELSKW